MIVLVLVVVAVACVHGAFEQDHASPNFGIVVTNSVTTMPNLGDGALGYIKSSVHKGCFG